MTIQQRVVAFPARDKIKEAECTCAVIESSELNTWPIQLKIKQYKNRGQKSVPDDPSMFSMRPSEAIELAEALLRAANEAMDAGGDSERS